jgi:hypothetical protein
VAYRLGDEVNDALRTTVQPDKDAAEAVPIVLMLAMRTSPCTTPAGAAIVRVALVDVAEVALPRRATCALEAIANKQLRIVVSRIREIKVTFTGWVFLIVIAVCIVPIISTDGTKPYSMNQSNIVNSNRFQVMINRVQLPVISANAAQLNLRLTDVLPAFLVVTELLGDKKSPANQSRYVYRGRKRRRYFEDIVRSLIDQEESIYPHFPGFIDV